MEFNAEISNDPKLFNSSVYIILIALNMFICMNLFKTP